LFYYWLFNNGCANVGLAVNFEVKRERRKVKGNNSSGKCAKTVTGWQKIWRVKVIFGTVNGERFRKNAIGRIFL
jgi:hypothetical protein